MEANRDKNMPRPWLHTARKWLVNVGLVAASLLISLGVLEVVLRVYEQRLMESMGIFNFEDRQRDKLLDNLLYHGLTTPINAAWQSDGSSLIHRKSDDPILVYELKPNVVLGEGLIRTNGMGFRDYEFTMPKPPGVYRIIVVGDSITFGWFQKSENTYPKVLEQMLNQAAPARRYEVFNMGVGGYNAAQELELIKTKALSLSPDLIVVGYCVNDNQIGADAGLWRHFTRSRLHIVDFIKLRLLRARMRASRKDLCETSYEELARVSKKTGVPVLITVFPSATVQANVFAANTARLASRLGFEVVDLQEAYTRAGLENVLMPGDIHPTDLGHRIAAEELFKHLKSHRR